MIRVRPSVLVLLAVVGVFPPLRPATAQVNLDQGVIRSIVTDLATAWNAKDVDRWVENFSEDSGFTNILGMHFASSGDNRARHGVLFNTVYALSTMRADVLEIRPLGTDAAVARARLTLTAFEALPPGVQETESGELHMLLLAVMERRNGRWLIVSAQETAVFP
jgi:uncharacterized protein (TIGR02246 family)